MSAKRRAKRARHTLRKRPRPRTQPPSVWFHAFRIVVIAAVIGFVVLSVFAVARGGAQTPRYQRSWPTSPMRPYAPPIPYRAPMRIR